MVTKLVTTIWEMFFLIHKIKLDLISTKCEDIHGWKSHIEGLDNLWKQSFLLIPHSAKD